MPTSQGENWDKTVSLEANIQKMPARTAAAKQPASPTYEGSFVAEAQINPFPYRILVVDDDPSIREVARAILESQGYEVLTVADGLDGLRALMQVPSRCDHFRSEYAPDVGI
jgi:PleD family two-component response regulator